MPQWSCSDNIVSYQAAPCSSNNVGMLWLTGHQLDWANISGLGKSTEVWKQHLKLNSFRSFGIWGFWEGYYSWCFPECRNPAKFGTHVEKSSEDHTKLGSKVVHPAMASRPAAFHMFTLLNGAWDTIIILRCKRLSTRWNIFRDLRPFKNVGKMSWRR